MGNGNEKPAPQPLLDSAWRKVDWINKDTLVERVKEYQLPNKNSEHLRILLHGPVGAGKSSFINSVSSIFRGRMTHGAHVDNINRTTYTRKYRTHTIQKGNAQNFFPFVFNDIIGLEENDVADEEDIKLIMKGHVKDGYLFNSAAAMSTTDPHYNSEPTPEDKIHVLICVIPGDKVTILPKEVIDKIRRIRLAASDLGIPQLCIITKIDLADPLMKEDVKNVYKMKIVKEKMEEFSSKVGIPMTCIYPVKNYHEETDLDDDIDVLILKALQQMIDLGGDFTSTMAI